MFIQKMCKIIVAHRDPVLFCDGCYAVVSELQQDMVKSKVTIIITIIIIIIIFIIIIIITIIVIMEIVTIITSPFDIFSHSPVSQQPLKIIKKYQNN